MELQRRLAALYARIPAGKDSRELIYTLCVAMYTDV
jgi:hypothetical protein